jgi:tRNA nucleotidyltransferase (CCA-adding enzyme)
MLENLSARISHGLPQPVVTLLRTAGSSAAGSNWSLYLVGGIVRDLILGRPGKDIDLMTDGDATELAFKLARETGSKLTLYKKFGTATFNIGDYRIDMATCRSEIYQRPGALPDVKPGSIKEDLFRRDFTVNAMAININPAHYGELIDLYGSRADLKAGVIRILHDKSFQDDATRIMRAVRYEQRLGFKFEPKTEKLLKGHLNMLDTISSERLRNELVLWLSEQQPEKILDRAGSLGILKKLHPGLRWDHSLAVAFKRSACLLQAYDKLPLYFCLLAYRLDEIGLYELLQRLNMTGSKLDLLTHHMMEIKNSRDLLMKKGLKNSQLYFRLNGHPLTAIQANWLYPNHRLLRSRLGLYLKKLINIKPYSSGADLATLGISQGPLMGNILNAILSARLDGEIKTRKDEERLALALAVKLMKPGRNQ